LRCVRKCSKKDAAKSKCIYRDWINLLGI
jgi:hypothetical protein